MKIRAGRSAWVNLERKNQFIFASSSPESSLCLMLSLSLSTIVKPSSHPLSHLFEVECSYLSKNTHRWMVLLLKRAKSFFSLCRFSCFHLTWCLDLWFWGNFIFWTLSLFRVFGNFGQILSCFFSPRNWRFPMIALQLWFGRQMLFKSFHHWAFYSCQGTHWDPFSFCWGKWMCESLQNVL